MTVEAFFKWCALGALAFIGLIAAGIGTLFLRDAQPWYDNRLIEAMSSGSASTTVDVSDRVAPLLPAGMPSRRAAALLWWSGFSCSAQSGRGVGTALWDCTRAKSYLVCASYYDVSLSLADAAVVKAQATKRSVCL